MRPKIRLKWIFWIWITLVLGSFGGLQTYLYIKQRYLLQIVQHLATKPIIQISILSDHGTRQYTEQMTLHSEKIKKFRDYLKTADIAQIGGHNHSRYRCLITIIMENGMRKRFFGAVYSSYEWNKDDLYLYPLSNTQSNPQYYSDLHAFVRIKNLGKWLIDYTLKRSAD